MGRRSTAPVDAIFVPKETSYETTWVCSNDRNTDGTTLKAASLIAMIQYVVLNIFVYFGERVFKQLHGFPMGINCGVEMADIYLLSYELAFALRQLKKFRASLETRSRRSTAQPVINEAAFSHTLPPVLLWLMTTVRYIDDVFMPILRDYDVAQHIYDRRSEGGNDGVHCGEVRVIPRREDEDHAQGLSCNTPFETPLFSRPYIGQALLCDTCHD